MNIAKTIAVIALAAAAVPAAAATFSTTLSGANETVPNASTATGFGTLVLSAAQDAIQVDLSWSGLTANATGAHVHCCAAQGANGPIAIDFEPDPVATGSVSLFYDLTIEGTFTPGFITANGGSVASARTAFVNGLTSGLAYYNVHNANFRSGEIRGQLALAAVPEPATWALMIGGFGLVGSAMRRRADVAA